MKLSGIKLNKSLVFEDSIPGLKSSLAAKLPTIYIPSNIPVDIDGDTMNSWILNTTTGVWEPPVAKPSGDNEPTEEERLDASGNDLMWLWDESAYQADNTKGWVLRTL